MLLLDNAWYKDIIDCMWEAVWIWDENEKTVYANKVFLDIVWYNLNEIIGKESYNFRDDESIQIVKDNNLLRKKWQKSTYYGYLKSRKWELIPVYTSGTPISWWWTVWIMTDLRILNQSIEKINHLTLLVNNMLNMMILSKDFIIDSHKVSFFSIISWLESMIQKYKNISKKNHVRTLIEVQPGIENCQIVTNLDALIEVIENLYVSLLSFTKPNWWEIFIKIIQKNHKEIYFEIIDNGLWIPHELTKNIFSNFSNLQKIKKNNHDTLWFAIYVAKELVKKMWSSLHIESKYWVGNIISFKVK